MGGNHSQENNCTQNFSTIALPPPMVHQQHQSLDRNETLPASSDMSRPDTYEGRIQRRERLYRHREESQNSAEDTESDDWIKIDRVSHKVKGPTRSQLSPTPTSSQPPRVTYDSTQDAVEIPRLSLPRLESAPSHSRRNAEEQQFTDLSDLLSRLQEHFGSHPNGNGDQTADRSVARPQVSERIRVHRERPSTDNVGRERPQSRHHQSASIPNPPFIFLRRFEKTKCPLCSKEFPVPDFEEHLAICSTKPRVQFNVDKLTQDAGECSICLDDLVSGDEIGRLPCLCVYHVKCLRGWYKKSQTCPEHPDLSGTA